MRHVFYRNRLTLALAILALGLQTGCRSSRYVVPEYSTALDQLGFAKRYEAQHRQFLLSRSRRDEIYERFIETYKKVIEKFPEDELYTPEAIITVGKLYFEQGKYKKAQKYFERALKDYANNDRVQSLSLFMKGQCLELRGHAREAQAVYRDFSEVYEGHPEPEIRALVRKAKELQSRVLKED